MLRFWLRPEKPKGPMPLAGTRGLTKLSEPGGLDLVEELPALHEADHDDGQSRHQEPQIFRFAEEGCDCCHVSFTTLNGRSSQLV